MNDTGLCSGGAAAKMHRHRPAFLGIGRLLIASAALAAFGWALTNLKPVPQVLLAAIPLAGVLAEFLTARAFRSVTFLFALSITSLFGFLFATSELAARAGRALFPTEHRAMSIAPIFLGGVMGISLFVLELFIVLKPEARSDRMRCIVLAAFLATALVSIALDATF